MHGPTVPEDDNGSSEMSKQLAQVPCNRELIDAVIDQSAEAKPQPLAARRKGESRNRGDFFAMLGLVSQKRGLAFRSQCSTDERC
jgi:hypothetical protein